MHFLSTLFSDVVTHPNNASPTGPSSSTLSFSACLAHTTGICWLKREFLSNFPSHGVQFLTAMLPPLAALCALHSRLSSPNTHFGPVQKWKGSLTAQSPGLGAAAWIRKARTR